MAPLDRLELPPRLVDWSILAAVGVALATGLTSLVSGQPGEAFVFVLHGIGGLSLVLLLFWKLRRVRRRITTGAAWDRATPVSVLLATAALGALATGTYWAFGGSLDLGPWGLLNLHIGLGLLVVPLLVYHLRHRFRVPSTADFEGRRTALSYAAVVGVGALAWRLQGAANALLDTAGARRRFTGSREKGTDGGNGFPVTSWVADDPEPVDTETWALSVDGRVARPLELGYGDVDSETDAALDSDGRRALLDCTSGWYSEHDWRGRSVGDLLDAADADPDARWVSFRSVTGYRWSLPLPEARAALLATHVDGERLSHGHGFPLRLVAPGRRGFQWVKWVESVEITRNRNLSEWLAVFVSGFD